jgi:hypothetical protein
MGGGSVLLAGASGVHHVCGIVARECDVVVPIAKQWVEAAPG